MDDYESLKRTKWECKYHVVFIPKCRKKLLYGQLRRELGPVFRELAERTEGYSGSDLRLVIREAVLNALLEDRKRLGQDDLLSSVEEFGRRISEYKRSS